MNFVLCRTILGRTAPVQPLDTGGGQGARLQMGVETVLDTAQFNGISDGTDTDFVISGEGRVDSQSQQGKIVTGVDKRTEMLESHFGALNYKANRTHLSDSMLY